MKIVADESVDFGIIEGLRRKGYEVYAVIEKERGLSDDDVLSKATVLQGLLITEDKDFGELTYRVKKPHTGIVLIRLQNIPRSRRIKTAVELIDQFFNKLQHSFSVLTEKGFRIKPLP